MTLIRTNLGNTRESARQLRFEPVDPNTATNVQQALEQIITFAIAAAIAAVTNKQDKVGTARLPASAATIAILTSDQEVGINTTNTAVSADLPTATAWAAANPNGLELVLFDDTGHADSHNITTVAGGGDLFVGGLTPLVLAPFGLIKLRPIPGVGWYLRS